MRIQYILKNFRDKSLAMIEKAVDIIAEYAQMGYDLTLRQLYYQFVARDLIPNSQRSYQNLGNLINDARLAGIVDWDRIKDRTRSPKGNSHWRNPASIIRSAAYSYAIDKWEDQPRHVEVWVEKDALIDVVRRACEPLDVTCFSCRGFVSQTAMHDAARRMISHERNDKETILLHFGDHDPSGMEMTEDIRRRLGIFRSDCQVERIALNRDQIDQYNPPPNFAKLSDSRAAAYIAEHGDQSWELDALDPRVISELIEFNVRKYRDDDLWDMAQRKEDEERNRLEEIADRLEEEMRDSEED